MYENAKKCTDTLWKIKLVAILVTVICAIPFTNKIGVAASICLSVLEMVALFMGSKDDQGYMKALIADIVCIILGGLTFTDGVLGSLMNSANTLLTLYVTYNIIMATSRLLLNAGSDELVAKGNGVWQLYLFCMIASAICSVLLIIPLINIIGALFSIVICITKIVAFFGLVSYLKQSSEIL